MTPAEVLAARRELGLSQRALARFLGVGFRTVQRWEYGQQDIPEMASMLLAWLAWDERPEREGTGGAALMKARRAQQAATAHSRAVDGQVGEKEGGVISRTGEDHSAGRK